MLLHLGKPFYRVNQRQYVLISKGNLCLYIRVFCIIFTKRKVTTTFGISPPVCKFCFDVEIKECRSLAASII